MNGSIQYAFFAVCLRFFGGFSGREKGLGGLLPLISGGHPSRPPASHPFLSWRPSSCPETAEAPVGISAEGGRLATRALPWAAQIQTRSRSRRRQARWRFRGGRAAPASRSGCPDSPVSTGTSAGASGRGQPAGTAAASSPYRLPAAVPGTGGPGWPRPWGASASSSFRPVSTPRWMRTCSAWGPVWCLTQGQCL